MLKKIGKIFLWLIAVCLALIFLLLIYFNFPIKQGSEKVELGVTFSSRYAQDIKIDWQANFLALLDDLGVRKIRIPVYWDLVEKNPGEYNFSDLDWQLQEAAKRQAEIVLVIGQKVPRWPECAIPIWAQNDDQIRKASLLKFINTVVKRYKNEPVIKFWQVENEPFLKFGICPPLDVQLLDMEIGLVRLLDSTRKIIVTDSGELSLWISAAKRADIFGTTMYRTIWKEGVGYFTYPIGPRFFHFKKWLAEIFTNQENFIVIELQTEPWISGFTTQRPLEEQFQSMDAAQLKENVEFAQKVGFPEVYLWGVEWWYW
ncbi:endo-1,4-beta-xylanase, partial [Patescibacteria group bacterium]|nr:endo-1,4-beta-xylanase [Patescibacteria group bacterium]